MRGAWGDEGESLANIDKPKALNLIPVPQKKKNVVERNKERDGVDLEDEFEFPTMDTGSGNRAYGKFFIWRIYHN